MTAGSVAANQRVAEIYVEAGDGTQGARGGAAELNVASDGDIVVISGLSGTAVARIRILGGDSPAATTALGTTPGQGGDARIGSAITPAGAISVTSRIAGAIVQVKAGDGNRATASESARGGAASITANGISAVSQTGSGVASVTASSGNSVGSSLGVDATINSSGGTIKVLTDPSAGGAASVQASGGRSETGKGGNASILSGGINVQSGGANASVVAEAGLSDSGAGGSARVESVGGGIMGRAGFMKSDAGVSYAEFSARAGRAETEFSSNEYELSRHDLSSSYYGFHAGIGRIFNLTDFTSFDLYGKWLNTRQGDKSLTIQDTHPLKFDAISSSRLRVGFRVSNQVSGYIRPYVGLAYERELDGKAKASIAGYAIGVPELKGGTGI
ncbi:MAG: hypothetical protein LBR80_09590 [Deltaproteobacteria bacterium]|nr:hypothetical protein [Deltaproteobacteria bacterium]